MKEYTKKYVSIFMKAAILLVPELSNNETVCRKLAMEMIKKYNQNKNVVIAKPFLYTNDMGVKKATPIGNFIAQNGLDIGDREIIISQKGIRYSNSYHVPPCWEKGMAYNLPEKIEI